MRNRALVFLIPIGLFLAAVFYLLIPRTAEESFEEFLSLETKESYLTQPLCAAGRKVVPVVIERIKDKNLDRRRYAIGFLGSDDYPEALPVLFRILEDDTETDVFRGDALNAIFLLSRNEGSDLALKYRGRADYLGRVANELIKVQDYDDFKDSRQSERCNPGD